jgi:hypothetical protein
MKTSKKQSRLPGRPRAADPRKTTHITLSTAEREACDAMAARVGLGFSPWTRFVLLSAAAEEVAAGQLPASSVGEVFKIMSRAIVQVLRDLPGAQAEATRKQLATALSLCSEEPLKDIHLLGAKS